MRALLKSIVALAALAAPLYANAIPMTWNYTGTCEYGDCDIIPSITGTLSGDPERIWPNDELNGLVLLSGDLTSYSFWIGGYHLTGTRAAGSLELDGSGNIIGGEMTFGDIARLEFLDLNNAEWHFSDSHCNIIIIFPVCRTDVEAEGSGSFALASAVPEPATLSLFGLGLLGFGLARRRYFR